MNEDFLHYIWTYRLFDDQNLFSDQGHRLCLIDTGRLNRDSGPDFFEARIEIDGLLWVGNVEIHLKSSDWYKHHHDSDAAYNNVILHVVYENDVLSQYTAEKNGVFSDYIYFIDETEDSKIISGHKSSLSIVDISQYEYKFSDLGFTKELEYILPKSNYLTSSNYQWVGTYKGAVRIPKINNNVKNYVPELIFENIKINEEIKPQQEEYKLLYGKYFIEFNFSANYLLNSRSIQYQCFLEGFDKDWSTLSFDETNMRYQSLSDGEYIFRLRLLMNGKQTNEEKTIKIYIKKPYWKSTWFYVLLFFLLLLIIAISIILTNRRNKLIKIQLQAEVKRQTADLVKKNNEVAQLSDQYLEAKNNAEYKSKQIEDSITYARYIQKVLLRKKDYEEWIK